MKIRIVWSNVTIAESENFKIVGDNYYFSSEFVQIQYLKKNGNRYISRWKGVAEYYDIIIDGEVKKDAAWSYPDPNKAVEDIKDFFSFREKIEIIR